MELAVVTIRHFDFSDFAWKGVLTETRLVEMQLGFYQTPLSTASARMINDVIQAAQKAARRDWET
jgi:hypothetical protein